jgi:hypothetical protein
MTARHECPDCEARFTGNACPTCGWTPPSGASKADWRCTWEVLAGRCYLPGTIGTKAALCTWHSHDPRHATLDEFERWQLTLLDGKYCAVWTHYRAGDLWRAVRGEAPLPAPVACLASGCPHRPTPPTDVDWRRAITLATANARPRRNEPEPVSAIIREAAP